MARRGYPPEFRRRVVDLVEGGRKVAEVAAELVGLGVEQPVQGLFDRAAYELGEVPPHLGGLTPLP